MSNILDQFLSLRTRYNLAQLLEVHPKLLAYYVFRTSEEKQYHTFEVPKRRGKEKRQITAPITPLKLIQQRLNEVLTAVYLALWLNENHPKCFAVHGFVPERSILTNAKKHENNDILLNIDLKDFFPSITDKRIYKMFRKKPYELPHQVAQAITYLCCYNNYLPQGAPTSPTLSNLVCVRMDRELQRFARKKDICYTRYSDDMTFSSHEFLDQGTRDRIQLEIQKIIERNGFSLHPDKVKWRSSGQRQIVTGLTVNEFPNVSKAFVKELRAMLYAWENPDVGLALAAHRYIELHKDRLNPFLRDQLSPEELFKRALQGKLAFLRHIKEQEGPNSTACSYSRRLRRLNPSLVLNDAHCLPPNHEIFTEGETDAIHLETALKALQAQGLYPGIKFIIRGIAEEGQGAGDDYLLSWLGSTAKIKSVENKIRIAIFDRDKQNTIKEAGGPSAAGPSGPTEWEDIRKWGNLLYSFIIPPTRHNHDPTNHLRVKARKETSIEHCYTLSDLQRTDAEGRRLYLSAEFEWLNKPNPNGVIGTHRLDRRVHYKGAKDINSLPYKNVILDEGIFSNTGDSLALSKMAFAQAVRDQSPGFEGIDFFGFKPLIDKIIKALLLAADELDGV